MIYEMVEKAISFDPLGREVSYDKFCHFVNEVVKQKSLIFMIGDFYGDIDLSEIAHKNEVYALIVRNRLEEYPHLEGKYELVDPTTFGASEMVLNKHVAQTYASLIKAQDERLYAHLIEHQIGFGKIYTDEDIYLRLSEILKG